MFNLTSSKGKIKMKCFYISEQNFLAMTYIWVYTIYFNTINSCHPHLNCSENILVITHFKPSPVFHQKKREAKLQGIWLYFLTKFLVHLRLFFHYWNTQRIIFSCLKLTTLLGVNLINVKGTKFSYKHRFVRFYYIYVTRKKAAKMMFEQQIC